MKILIWGAGLSGITAARLLAEKGNKVTIYDFREHIGGICYDLKDDYGTLYHKYGPHIFHTNNNEVWKFLSKFTFWTKYKHKVKALLEDNTYVTLPINKETKEIVGEENLIKVLIRPYTEKMWGRKLEKVNKDIIKRLPIREDYNELYFPDDKFQGLPRNGYTEMFKEILKHKNIKVKLKTKFNRKLEKDFDKVFCSYSIDEYYGYCFGKLEYRSIKFYLNYYLKQNLLPVATVNFTNKDVFTRMTEWGKMYNKKNKMNLLTIEEPCDSKDNNNERYYPIKDNKNLKLYNKYKKIKNNKTIFIGRLGLYKYLNMDKAIESTFELVKKL